MKPGLLETAQGGTVFLDEVGELPMTTQVKLLRVIEERQVYRVGSVKPRLIDVRFVAATNRDLEAEVALGSFRQDLFFRLDGISLVIPPLRERRDEIP
ncbi:MAG: sigma 54-interacting transcriptional regulator, partial [Polyangiaceae bacterium]